MVFLEWPKQQRHHEDHYSQSKYSSIRQCCNSSGISVFKWRRKVDRDGAEVTSSSSAAKVTTDDVVPTAVVRDLRIYVDSDVLMRSYIMKTVTA